MSAPSKRPRRFFSFPVTAAVAAALTGGSGRPRQAPRAAQPRMQAEQDLGKSKRRVLDGDAMVAGERDLEPAAEAIAVHDRDRRRRQAVEPVDHSVRLDKARLDGAGVGPAAK